MDAVQTAQQLVQIVQAADQLVAVVLRMWSQIEARQEIPEDIRRELDARYADYQERIARARARAEG